MNNSEGKKETLINEQIIDAKAPSLSAYLKEKRKSLRDCSGGGNRRKYYPMKKIADSLGISIDMLQQKVYGKKPMTRDWLIAICAAHGLDNNETNTALTMCGMPRLDRKIPREYFLIGYLYIHVGDSNSIEKVNYELLNRGLQELDINHHKCKRKEPTTPPKCHFPYEVIGRLLRTYSEGDPYDSLETAYDFRYRCVASALLIKDDGEKYELEADGDGRLSVKSENYLLPEIYETLEKTGEFRDYFSDLITCAEQEQHRVNDQLYDSKNYECRLGANLRNDTIHVFYEQYNYNSPERNEYYLMEYIYGNLRLSVSNQSMFMQEYLTEDNYRKRYGAKPKISRCVYNSLDEIMAILIDPGLPSYVRHIISCRKSAYQRLSKVVEDNLEKIRNRTLFIRNFDMIYDNPGDVCKYFGIEREFGCACDNEFGEIVLGANKAELADADGCPVIITFEEVKRAFELGFSDTNQICRIKRAKGTMESVLS